MKIIRLLSLFLLCITLASFRLPADRFVTYTVDPHKQHLIFYWKSPGGNIYGSLGNLRRQLEAKHTHLFFAMNGGMYKEDHAPLGLYIENGKTQAPLNRAHSSYGNFYLQPNGVFYLRADGSVTVCKTADFKQGGQVWYATQSGPMLVIGGRINPLFKKGSQNLNLRNGVGILPDGRVVFMISKQPVNFYDFACRFREMGCHNALYLDGFVSRMYLPEQGMLQTDGDFGVIIAVTD